MKYHCPVLWSEDKKSEGERDAVVVEAVVLPEDDREDGMLTTTDSAGFPLRSGAVAAAGVAGAVTTFGVVTEEVVVGVRVVSMADCGCERRLESEEVEEREGRVKLR
jgi:hypothetical protein